MLLRPLRRLAPPRRSRGLSPAVRAAILSLACTFACSERVDVARYLHDKDARRAALEASLVDGAHEYRAQRLAHYARDWDALPEWNPPVDDAAPLVISEQARAGDERALLELGRAAFVRYPAQRAAFDVDAFDALPLGAARPTHLVRVRYADGTSAVALTCATCHARTRDGREEMGAPHHALDLGALMLDAPLAKRGVDFARMAPLATWGPGRVDVTTRDGSEPALIPDLRAVRFQRHLQHAGAVQQRDVVSLAIRIETLVITAHDGAVRPPREVALGLALYLWSLADTLPPVDREAAPRAFTQHCARCHSGEGLAGGLVDVDKLGTDATLARSRDRGTGAYRATSLRGVGTRERLLHDGSARSLDELLSQHPRGLALSAEERRTLTSWLHGL
jgi:cytochrome c553